jgi:hypothetical protein
MEQKIRFVIDLPIEAVLKVVNNIQHRQFS